MNLSGRTALVTGSCGVGMGRCIALRLAHERANVILNYGTYSSGSGFEDHAREIARAVEQLGGRALIHRADTTDEDQVKTMVEAACAEFGAVDILVNNAGAHWEIRGTTEIPFNDWKSALATEINGPYLLWKAIIPGMRERRWGRVIYLGMNAAPGLEQTAGLAPDYCLGKAARTWLTKAFGLQEFSHGITVNCIEPGIIANIDDPQAVRASSGDLEEWKTRSTATSHDIAEVVAFLCSEAGRFVSGSVIRLPCGFPLS